MKTAHRHPCLGRANRRQLGVTLIESCVTAAISAVSLGCVAPAFQTMLERQHLIGVAAQVKTDITFARSLAVDRNQTLRMSFVGSSCYIVHTGSAGSCSCRPTGGAACSGDAEILRATKLDNALPVTLQSNSPSIVFDAAKGTVTPTATIRVIARSGTAIHEVVNVMGRVRSCSPAPALSGYKTC